MNYAGELKKLKAQELAPSEWLWTRITDTLARRNQRSKDSAGRRYYLAFSAAALAVCAVAVFTGRGYYDHYELGRYLAQSLDYTSYSSQVYENWGTYI
ncbi:MAG: hypothetical protein LBQ83_05585 [Candidatus Margulisbacteria bacterium]|jgi:hypothetical protein|nr:hypothetical protein [Candidatus Margulisiibacteriota bacterium]